MRRPLLRNEWLLSLLHVLFLAANESLIYLDLILAAPNLRISSELLPYSGTGLKRMRCIMNHADFWVIPRWLAYLVRTNPILAIGQQPNGSKPLVGGDRRILHDGSNLRGELALGMHALALPLALILEEYHVGRGHRRGRSRHHPASAIGSCRPEHCQDCRNSG